MKKHIHIHIHDSKWEESKHPRKDDGKFGSGSVSRKLDLDNPKERQLAHGLLKQANAAARAKVQPVAEKKPEPGMKLSKQDLKDIEAAVETKVKEWRDELPAFARGLQNAHHMMKAGQPLQDSEVDLMREAIYDRNKQVDEEEDAKRLSDLYTRFKAHHKIR